MFDDSRSAALSWFRGTIWALVLILSTSLVGAEERPSITVPEGTKFVLQLDLQGFQRTELGERLLKFAKQEMLKEIGKKHGGHGKHGSGGEPDFDQFNKMLGFDPFSDIQGITISASDFEHPEKSLMAVVRMKETTGNLEGLLLGLPGYEVDDYRKYRVHSVRPDDEIHLHAAFHTDSEGDKSIVLAPRRDSVESLLDQLDGRSAHGDGMEEITLSSSEHAILQLQVLDLPEEMLGEGPQANVAKILESLLLSVGEDDGELKVTLHLTAKDEPQAEQLQQMAQGLIAAVNFAKSADPDDEDLQKFGELVQGLEATRDEDAVKVGLSIDSDELLELIEDELN